MHSDIMFEISSRDQPRNLISAVCWSRYDQSMLARTSVYVIKHWLVFFMSSLIEIFLSCWAEELYLKNTLLSLKMSSWSLLTKDQQRKFILILSGLFDSEVSMMNHITVFLFLHNSLRFLIKCMLMFWILWNLLMMTQANLRQAMIFSLECFLNSFIICEWRLSLIMNIITLYKRFCLIFFQRKLSLLIIRSFNEAQASLYDFCISIITFLINFWNSVTYMLIVLMRITIRVSRFENSSWWNRKLCENFKQTVDLKIETMQKLNEQSKCVSLIIVIMLIMTNMIIIIMIFAAASLSA